ncbi:MAG TPA: hypothetical protein VIN73_11765 [Vicingaceae bacterium]
MNKKSLIPLLFSLIFCVGFIQQNSDCINEILKLEEKIYAKKYTEKDKPTFLSYSLKTIDWENKTVNVDVKMYRAYNNMHFFSNQTDIYQNEKEMIMVLKLQKLIVLENSNEEIMAKGLNEDFLAVKRNFLNQCELVSCAAIDSDKEVKRVELKVNDDMNGALFIDKMIYKYKPASKEILSNSTFYKKGYKVKQIDIKYNKLDLEHTYKFNNPKRYVMDAKENLLSKYAGYELIDNRK